MVPIVQIDQVGKYNLYYICIVFVYSTTLSRAFTNVALQYISKMYNIHGKIIYFTFS